MHRCLEGSWQHVEDLSDLLLGSAFLNLIRAKTLLGTTAHDDDLFPSAVAVLRPRAPLLAAYVSSWWGLVALLDGEDELAASLAEDYYQVRQSTDLGRPARRDNTVLGSLLAARETRDTERLHQLGNGIEDLVVRLDRKGEHSEAAMSRVVAAGIYRRGGHDNLAEPHQRRFRALRRTFTDATFLDRLEAWVDAHVAAVPVPSRSSPIDLLTPRQREIAGHLPSDLSIAAIADQLFISPHTLRTHLREIYRRLGVRSRHEAVARLQ
jgi:DNA-binding CsgD family transcriptional regulator